MSPFSPREPLVVPPAVYQLLAFPGTGKYTVARAMVGQLEARGEPAALLDNHSFVNLVWSFVPTEQRFDPDVMGRINEIRRLVVSAAGEHAGPDHSLVFTNFLPAGQRRDVADPHRDLATKLGKRFVPVILECDRDEVLRRVANADRSARFKLDVPHVAARIMDEGMTIPDWPELVRLDITGLTPDEAAARVLALNA
jgi:hypothetical protein